MKYIVNSLIVLLMFSFSSVQAGSLKSYKGNLKNISFELKDLDGKTHRLSDFKGQVLLIQFWASYCTPCRTEMPSMNNLQKKLANKPFKILAINMAEERDEIEKFVTEVKPEFTILHDTDGSVLQQWKVFVAPASFILDQNGAIKYVLYGAVEWDSADIIKPITALMK